MKHSYTLWGSLALFIFGACFLPVKSADAQYNSSGKDIFSPGVTKNIMVGDFDFGASVTGKNAQKFNFDAPGTGLIDLYRMNHFFFMTAIGGDFGDAGNPTIGLNFMNLSYMLPHGWEIRAGQFDAMPFGRFPRTYDPSWIWPIQSTPIGMYTLGLTNGDFGVMVQNAGYIGNSVIRYYAYLTNGPTLDSSNGLIGAPTVTDNNKYKMIGGRVSLSPYALSNLEVGVSAAYTRGAGDAGTKYANTPVSMYAFDVNYTPTINSLSGYLRLRGQLNLVDVGQRYYMYQGQSYTFKNNSSTYFGMVSYQPSMASSSFLSSLMFTGMFSHINVPTGAHWGRPSESRYALGVTYWFNWRTNLKFNYEINQHGGNSFAIHVGVQI